MQQIGQGGGCGREKPARAGNSGAQGGSLVMSQILNFLFYFERKLNMLLSDESKSKLLNCLLNKIAKHNKIGNKTF